MTRKELIHVLEILARIKDKDEHVSKAIAYINKDLANYNARKGQLRDMYESEYRNY